MRVLVWLVEDTWQVTVAEAAELLPPDAEITLLHVIPTEVETVLHGARAGLLGRRHALPPPQEPPLTEISENAARELLAAAQNQLGRAATLQTRRGRVEREVVAAAEGADLLVMARDGDRGHLSPRSIGPHARFVIDHAPCRVLLVWPDQPPPVSTIPPAPH
jgi:nucleotide-binding universal stress UspA family protein